MYVFRPKGRRELFVNVNRCDLGDLLGPVVNRPRLYARKNPVSVLRGPSVFKKGGINSMVGPGTSVSNLRD